jgi:hypothetical protein
MQLSSGLINDLPSAIWRWTEKFTSADLHLRKNFAPLSCALKTKTKPIAIKVTQRLFTSKQT